MKRYPRSTHCFYALLAAGAALLASCGKPSPLPTVDGPEATDLIEGVNGYIVISRHRGEIAAISLPALEEVTLRAPAPQDQDFLQAYSVSGPDEEGRIAFIDDGGHSRSKDERHFLKTMKLDTKQEEEVFTRPRGVLWNDLVGEHLALAHTGGRVAFASNLTGVQMPLARLQAGPLEVWDVTKKKGGEVGVTALDDGLSWFPDGKRLAYVELISPQEAEGHFSKLGDFGSSFKEWKKVPAAHVFDTETGKKSFLHLGWHPQVSADGKNVLVSDFDNRYRLIDVVSGKAEAAGWAGKWGRAIALLGGKRVLSWGRPTTGSEVRYTNAGSRGPQQVITLKLAEINSDKFQTVVPYIDARRRVSFGSVKK